MEDNTNQPNSNISESNIPASHPVSSPINPPTGQKSKFPLALIIGVILFLLIAGSAAGFYVFKQQGSNIAEKSIPSPTVQKQIPNLTFISTSCNSDADCGSDSSCMTAEPLIAGQTPHKICVQKGSAIPL